MLNFFYYCTHVTKDLHPCRRLQSSWVHSVATKIKSSNSQGKTHLAFLSSNWEGLRNPILRGASPNLQCNATLSLICYLNLFSSSCHKQLLSCSTQSTMKLLCSCLDLHNQFNHMPCSNILPKHKVLPIQLQTLSRFLLMKSSPTLCSVLLKHMPKPIKNQFNSTLLMPNANTARMLFRTMLTTSKQTCLIDFHYCNSTRSSLLSLSLLCNTCYTFLPWNSIVQCPFYSSLSSWLLWVSRCTRFQLSSFVFTHMSAGKTSNVEVRSREFKCQMSRSKSDLLL